MEKCLEILYPSGFHRDSSAAVTRIGSLVGIEASLLHVGPGFVFLCHYALFLTRADTVPVLRPAHMEFVQIFIMKAVTASFGSSSQIYTRYDYRFAAVAEAFPFNSLASFSSPFDHEKALVPVTREILIYDAATF